MTRNQKIRLVAVLLLFLVSALTISYAWLTGLQHNKTKVIVTDVELQGIAMFAPGDSPNNTYPISSLVGNFMADPENNNRFVSGQAISVSFNTDDANYLGNLRFAVRYSGTSPVYLRVSVYEQWVSGDTYLPAERIRYTVPTGASNYLMTDSAGQAIALPPMPETGETTAPDTSETTAAGTEPYTGIPVLPEEHFSYGVLGEWFNDEINFRYYYDTAVLPIALQPGAVAQNQTSVGSDLYLYLFDGLTEANIAAIQNRYTPGAELKILFVVEAVQPNRYREFWDISALPFATAETTVAP